jgi:HlyD family secretion protein
MASQKDRERNLQRIQTLFQEGAIAKVEVDDAAVAATLAEQDTRSARANLEQVKTPRPEDLAEASANLERERASLRAAESQLKNQQATFDAKFSLRSTAANSQTEVLTSSASISRAQSEVSRCRAKIAQIDVQISQSRITSPINGIISRRSVNIGQTVQSGTQLFRVTSAEAYRAIANVDEKYVWQLNEGQSATIQPEAFPDLQIPAIVEEISREANQDRGTVKVRFRLLKRDGRLRADLSLDINVTTADLSERIVVPDSALLREGKLVYVMAIIGDTVKKVAVKVDRQTDKGTVLLEGVSEGDVLVSEPRTVTEGQRVVVKAEQQ